MNAFVGQKVFFLAAFELSCRFYFSILKMIKHVVFIGAGNLATHLATALYDSGINIVQVYSRTVEAARALAGRVNASFTNELSAVKTGCDLYVISVKDDALELVIKQLNFGNSLVVHTAGSLPMSVLAGYSPNYGVLYPFQTFTKTKKVDFTKIPVCIEANSVETEKRLEDLSKKISYKIIRLNSEQRMILHVAAVLSCNFVNHLYTLSELLLKENGMKLELLFPLIRETTEKAMQISPKEAQTGPAMRNDSEIISKHLALLADKPEVQALYRMLSESIYQIHHS